MALQALTGYESNLPANKTSTSDNASTNSNATTGTSTTSRNLVPGQSDLLNNLFNYTNTAMNNPSSITAPYQSAARDQTNQNYAGLADTLRQQFMSNGGGGSGKFGMALAQGDQQRLGQLSNVDNSFAQQNAALPLSIANSLGNNLLNLNLGSTTSGSGGSSGSSTSNTTNVAAGSPTAGALQGGTSALMQGLMMAALMM